MRAPAPLPQRDGSLLPPETSGSSALGEVVCTLSCTLTSTPLSLLDIISASLYSFRTACLLCVPQTSC